MRIHNRILLAVNLLLACGVAFSAPQWAWEAGKQSSNGAITLKSTGNVSTTYTGTQNPTGANVKVNQNAVTQPPTVIIQASSGGKIYRPEGTGCADKNGPPSSFDTDIKVMKTGTEDQMTCWPTWNVWYVQQPLSNCFVGMPLSLIATKCIIGQNVTASSMDATPIGKYAGYEVTSSMHLIVSNVSTVTKRCNTNGAINSSSVSDGFGNTNIIEAVCGSSPAVVFCKNIGANWFIPARNQFQLLHNNGLRVFGYGMTSTSYSGGGYMYSFDVDGSYKYFYPDYPHVLQCVRGF